MSDDTSFIDQAEKTTDFLDAKHIEGPTVGELLGVHDMEYERAAELLLDHPVDLDRNPLHRELLYLLMEQSSFRNINEIHQKFNDGFQKPFDERNDAALQTLRWVLRGDTEWPFEED